MGTHGSRTQTKYNTLNLCVRNVLLLPFTRDFRKMTFWETPDLLLKLWRKTSMLCNIETVSFVSNVFEE